MRYLKQLLLAVAVMAVPALSHAGPLMRSVFISTNSFSVQSGSINVEGVQASSITIRNQVRFLTPSTSGQFLLSAGLNLPAFFSHSGRIIQVVSSHTIINRTNASTTPTDTGLFGYITPKSSASIVAVFVSQNCFAPTDHYVDLQLMRGITTLLRTPCINNGATGGNVTVNAPILYIDSPATADTQLTYKMTFTREAGAGTVEVQDIDNGFTSRSAIVLIEIGQ